jgi:hypothetical protein
LTWSSTEAKDRLSLLINNARHSHSILALARCALSTALEQQGHYRDSLAAVSMYESPESRVKLDEQTVSYLRVQIGLAYNYNGDHPKAIAMLQATLREHAETGTDQSRPHLRRFISHLSNHQRIPDCPRLRATRTGEFPSEWRLAAVSPNRISVWRWQIFMKAITRQG